MAFQVPQTEEISSSNQRYNGLTAEDIPLCKDDEKKAKESSDPSNSAFMPLIACIVVLITICFTALGSASVQVLNGTIPEFELNAWRFVVQFIIMIPVIMRRKCQLKVPYNKCLLLSVNILLLNAMNVLLFTVYIYLPLGLADGLINGLTIAGNALLSICFKADRKLFLYIGAFLSVFGTLLMIQPHVLFSNANLPPPPIVNWTPPCVKMDSQSGDVKLLPLPVVNWSSPCSEEVASSNQQNSHNHTVNPSATNGPIVLGYVLAISYSVTTINFYHTMNRLVKDVDPFTIGFWNALVGTLLSVMLMLIFEEPVFLQSSFCIGLLLLHCIGTTSMSVSQPWCLQYLRPTVLGMLFSWKLVIMVILQHTIMRDIKPGLQNWVEILGAVICFFGMIGGPLTEIIKDIVEKQKSESPPC